VKRLRKILFYVVPISFLMWAGWYVYFNYTEFKILSNIRISYIVTITVCYILSLVVTSIMNMKILQKYNLNIGLWEHFRITVVASCLNMITPVRGGAAFRAVYMRQKYGFDYSSFLASMTGMYILNIFVLSSAGIITMVVIGAQLGCYDPVSSFIFFFIAIMLGCIIFRPRHTEISKIWKGLSHYSLKAKIKDAFIGWSLIRTDGNFIYIYIFLTLCNLILGSLIIHLSFESIGLNVHVVVSLYLSIVQGLSGLITISPGGLGIVEAIMIFVSRELHIEVAQILLIAMIYRIIFLSTLIILTPPILISMFGLNWRSEVTNLRKKVKHIHKA
jgi:uncharacterized membrane protein YbhN (UPF0104 family)